jgi:PAS domain S-box-containing protein
MAELAQSSKHDAMSVRGESEAAMIDTLRPVAGLLAALFLCFVPFDLVHKPAHASWLSAALDVSTGCLWGLLHLALRRRLIPPRGAHLATALMAWATASSALVDLVAVPDPIYAAYLVLIIVGTGSVTYSLGWLLLTDAVLLGAWAPLAWKATSGSDFGNIAVCLLSSVVISVGVQAARRRIRLKLASESAQRQATQEALAARERHFRSMIEDAWDIIAILDPQGVLTYVNPAVTASLRYKPEELTGRSLLPIVHADDGASLLDELGRVASPGEPRVIELRLSDRDGQWHIMEVCLKAVEGPQGRHFVANIRDITLRRELEARIARADRMASIGMLAAGVAHEINNPLTYVYANLDFLKDQLPGVFEEASLLQANGFRALQSCGANADTLAELTRRGDRIAELAGSVMECIRDAGEGCERVALIVRDMKGYAHIRDEAESAVEMRDIIEAALKMAQNEIRFRARIVRDYDDVPPVLVNETRLCQVFLNLVLNAAQAIDEGNVAHHAIRVRTFCEGDQVVGEIADTGKGIAPEHLNRLFNPFFSTKPAGVGTGLGLSISDKIVRSYGGKIEVLSQAGRGTQVRVRLPRAKAALAGSGSTAVKPSTAGAASGRARVLVVDDEPRVRASIERVLRREHEVQLAESGAAAIALLKRDAAFDVILSDLVMPEVSGAEFYQWVLANEPRLAPRMVFMTGAVFTRRIAEFLASVSNPTLDKPLKFDALLALIDRMIRAAAEKADREPAGALGLG